MDDPLATHSLVAAAVARHAQPYVDAAVGRGEAILEIGAGNCPLKHVLLRRHQQGGGGVRYLAVDPHSTHPEVEKIAGEEALARTPGSCLILSKFAMHHLYAGDEKRLRERLAGSGCVLALRYAVSPQSRLFGDADFNRLFFAGFEPVRAPRSAQLVVPGIRVAPSALLEALRGRTWSHLPAYSSAHVEWLASRVPSPDAGLMECELRVDVHCYTGATAAGLERQPPSHPPSHPPSLHAHAQRRIQRVAARVVAGASQASAIWQPRRGGSAVQRSNRAWAFVRDCCQCDDCWEPTIFSRKCFLHLVSTTPAAVSAEVGADTATIRWTDGHRSCYRGEFAAHIRSLPLPAAAAAAAAASRRPQAWIPPAAAAAPSAPPVSFQGLSPGSEASAAALSRLQTDGFVHIRGVGSERGTLSSVAASLGLQVVESEWGLIQDLTQTWKRVNLVDAASDPLVSVTIPPHADLLSATKCPTILALHCLSQVKGGTSILVDGRAVGRRLLTAYPPAAVLARVAVGFRYTSKAGQLSKPVWRHILRCADNASGGSGGGGADEDLSGAHTPAVAPVSPATVSGLAYDNWYMQPCDAGADAETWYASYGRLSAMLLDPANQLQVHLEDGDALLVDNHRMLHGRRQFRLDPDPAGKQRHLQLCYMEVPTSVQP